MEERATEAGATVMRSLSDDVESLYLLKKCCEPEFFYGTILTDSLLANAEFQSLCYQKKRPSNRLRET